MTSDAAEQRLPRAVRWLRNFDGAVGAREEFLRKPRRHPHSAESDNTVKVLLIGRNTNPAIHQKRILIHRTVNEDLSTSFQCLAVHCIGGG